MSRHLHCVHWANTHSHRDASTRPLATVALATVTLTTVAFSTSALSTVALATVALTTVALATVALDTVALVTVALATVALATVALATVGFRYRWGKIWSFFLKSRVFFEKLRKKSCFKKLKLHNKAKQSKFYFDQKVIFCMNLDIFNGIGVVKLILLLHFTFGPKCLTTVGFRYRWWSDHRKSNGSKGSMDSNVSNKRAVCYKLAGWIFSGILITVQGVVMHKNEKIP